MPRNIYGYDTYRGRSGTQRVLTGIIVILVILLILAVCAFFLAQKYMVYTDDGRAHLELPFFQRESTQPVPTPPPQVSQDILIVTNPPEILPTPTPTPIAAPEVQSATHAFWLLRGHLLEGSWKGEMEKAGCDAALFNLKADDGTLGYVSGNSEAVRLKTTATDRKLNSSLTAVTATDQYVIARVSCFKDNSAPKIDNTLAVRTNSGYNWRDAADLRWMNVAVPAARAYVVETIKEIAALGVDEILLENSGYPTDGNLGYIKTGETYDPNDLSTPVETFYQEVREAIQDAGIKLSIATSEAVMLGRDDRSGQTLELLEKYADRVYVPQSEITDYAGLLDTRLKLSSQAPGTITLTPDRLVLMVPKGTAVDPAMSQLILR